MKKRYSSSILLSTLVVTLTVTSLLTISLSTVSVHADLTPHGPILILYDNFTLANGVTSGTGTVGDPYIIENYIINSSAAIGMIDIRNSTKYFVIRNCVLENGITAPGTGYIGIRLSTVVNGKVENCVSRNNNYGIALYYNSENNVITNNTFENSYWYGIRLENSHNNLISNNLIKNFASNYWGIGLWADKNNILDNNTIENVGGGIYLYDTENLKMRNNTVSCRGRKFGIEGDTLSHFIHDIDNSNLLEGRPLIYLMGHSNEVIDPSLEIGYLGLVNCDNILVENRVFARRTGTNNINGILMANTQNSRVENCTFENNQYGIYVWGSDNNILANNTCENNTKYGIFILYSSDNNIIENNTILKNPLSTGAGIGFYYNPVVQPIQSGGSGNIIRNNNITSNGLGISILKAENNQIYHNNFENNTTQAYDNGSNYWDDGYPSGGNYWSDYAGVDHYKGANQNISGSDGIGDTPYGIPGGSNRDNYPLMWAGTATIHLENLYNVGLVTDFQLNTGSKLVVKFYDYADTFESENVIWTITPPQSVVENENVPHPANGSLPVAKAVKKAELVLTTDDTANIISTIASFTVHQSDLRARITAILRTWGGSPEQQNAFRAELTDILKVWGSAPS